LAHVGSCLHSKKLPRVEGQQIGLHAMFLPWFVLMIRV